MKSGNTYDPQLPFYLQDWFLDIVCEGGTYEYIYSSEEKETISAIFYKKKGGIRYVTMPPLAPYLGIKYNYPDLDKRSSKLSFEEKKSKSLIKKLDEFPIVEFNLSPQVTNAFPFIKKGYRQYLKYTYIIPSSWNKDLYLERMDKKMRKEIERHAHKVEANLEIEEFLDLLKTHSTSKKLEKWYDIDIIRSLDKELSQRNKRKIYYIMSNGNLLGANYIIEDIDTNYNLLSISNPDIKSSNVTSSLIHKCILDTFDQKKAFDFEGSMIPGVENLFRRFGGIATPYYVIKKERNMFYRLLKSIRSS